ncbi:putative glutamic acid-rich protein [Neospora caninum Liverpool]|uniref:Glutamic acid-rich protein, putative n=1 Tax=Neospora caninum (strain Liverpool) TaxID=572307 RepID=F0VDD1_NEOCL|nr:putative glutamic acid-rich protein [Neospora caninum Liverpool]CBZ51646.1 putative glutamic acid-rich protein [Neospora caninum Liverpool]CEL65600.1 TPA: glutamic acid-rich protein, putative [Neospora caninum Liverpool]|eukprot:XP_003881679.1 putative glutamic acid-rich protein [Neospora caninum Liverpool]
MQTSQAGTCADSASQPSKAASAPLLAVRVLRCEGLKHTGMHAVEVEVGGQRRVSGWAEGCHDATFDFSSTFSKVPRDGNVRLSVWHKRSWRDDKRVCDTYFSIHSLFLAPAHAYRGWLGLEHNTRFAGQILVDFSLLRRRTTAEKGEGARTVKAGDSATAERGHREEAVERQSGGKAGEAVDEGDGRESPGEEDVQRHLGDRRGKGEGEERPNEDDVEGRQAETEIPLSLRPRRSDQAVSSVRRNRQQPTQSAQSSHISPSPSSAPHPPFWASSSSCSSSSSRKRRPSSLGRGEKREAVDDQGERSRDADARLPSPLWSASSPGAGPPVDLLSLDVEIQRRTEERTEETAAPPSPALSGGPAGHASPRRPTQQVFSPAAARDREDRAFAPPHTRKDEAAESAEDAGRPADPGDVSRETKGDREAFLLASDSAQVATPEKKAETRDACLGTGQRAPAEQPALEGVSSSSQLSLVRYEREERARGRATATGRACETRGGRNHLLAERARDGARRQQARTEEKAAAFTEQQTGSWERRERRRDGSRGSAGGQEDERGQREGGEEYGAKDLSRSGEERVRDLRCEQDAEKGATGPELPLTGPSERDEDCDGPRVAEARKGCEEARAEEQVERRGEQTPSLPRKHTVPLKARDARDGRGTLTPRLESAKKEPAGGVHVSFASASSPWSFSPDSQQEPLQFSPAAQTAEEPAPVDSFLSSLSSLSSRSFPARDSRRRELSASPAVLPAGTLDTATRERDWKALDEIFFAECSCAKPPEEGQPAVAEGAGVQNRPSGESRAERGSDFPVDARAVANEGATGAFSKQDEDTSVLADREERGRSAWRDEAVDRADERRRRDSAREERGWESETRKIDGSEETQGRSRGRWTREDAPHVLPRHPRRRYSANSENTHVGNIPDGGMERAQGGGRVRRSSSPTGAEFGERDGERNAGRRGLETRVGSHRDRGRFGAGAVSGQPRFAGEPEAFPAPLFPAQKETASTPARVSPASGGLPVREAPIFPADLPASEAGENDMKPNRDSSGSVGGLRAEEGARLVSQGRGAKGQHGERGEWLEDGTLRAAETGSGATWAEAPSAAVKTLSEEEKKRFHREGLVETHRETRAANGDFGPLHAYSPWGGVATSHSPATDNFFAAAPLSDSSPKIQQISSGSSPKAQQNSSSSWLPSSFPAVSWYPVSPPEQTHPSEGVRPVSQTGEKKEGGEAGGAFFPDSRDSTSRAGHPVPASSPPPFPSSSDSFEGVFVPAEPRRAPPAQEKKFSRLRFHLEWPKLKTRGKRKKTQPEASPSTAGGASPSRNAPSQDGQPGALGKPKEKRRSVSSRSTFSAPSSSTRRVSSPSFPAERDSEPPPFPLGDPDAVRSRRSSRRSRASSLSSATGQPGSGPPPASAAGSRRPSVPVLPPPPLDVANLQVRSYARDPLAPSLSALSASPAPALHWQYPPVAKETVAPRPNSREKGREAREKGREAREKGREAREKGREAGEEREALEPDGSVEFPPFSPLAQEEMAFARLVSDPVSTDAPPRLPPPPGDEGVCVEHGEDEAENGQQGDRRERGDREAARTAFSVKKKGTARRAGTSKKTRRSLFSSGSFSQGDALFPEAPAPHAAPLPLSPFLAPAGWTESGPSPVAAPVLLSPSHSSGGCASGREKKDSPPAPLRCRERSSPVGESPPFLGGSEGRSKREEREGHFFSAPPRTPTLAMPVRPPENALPDRRPLPPLSPEARRRRRHGSAAEDRLEAGAGEDVHVRTGAKMREPRPVGLPGGPYADRRRHGELARRHGDASFVSREHQTILSRAPAANEGGKKRGDWAHAVQPASPGSAVSSAEPPAPYRPSLSGHPLLGYPAGRSPFGPGSPGPESFRFPAFPSHPPFPSSCPPAYPATPHPPAPMLRSSCPLSGARPFFSSFSSPSSPFVSSASASPSGDATLQAWRESAGVECRNSAAVAPQMQVEPILPAPSGDGKANSPFVCYSGGNCASASPFATAGAPLSSGFAGAPGSERNPQGTQSRNPFVLSESPRTFPPPRSSFSAPVSSLPFSPSSPPPRTLPVFSPRPVSASAAFPAHLVSHSPFAAASASPGGVHVPGERPPGPWTRGLASQSDGDVDRNPFARFGPGAKKGSHSVPQPPLASSVAVACAALRAPGAAGPGMPFSSSASFLSLQTPQGSSPPSFPSSSPASASSFSSPFSSSSRLVKASGQQGAGSASSSGATEARSCEAEKTPREAGEAQTPQAAQQGRGRRVGEQPTLVERPDPQDARGSGAEDGPTRGRQRERSVNEDAKLGDGVEMPIQAPRFPSPTPH